MAKKLHYFNLNGLAEPIRYILHYTKQEFEDVRHGFDMKKEVKDKLPYGQLPIYEEGERILTQSLAIAKYVARNTDLIPVDPWVVAVVEGAAYTIYDFWLKIVPYIKEQDPEKKKELKKHLLEETIDFFFTRFEKHLQENGGYFGGKLTWVEFILCGIVEASNLFLDTELEKKYPAVEAVVEKIRNLPGVKEYIEKRGPYVIDQ
ncbi:glutathione S-transferase S1-like [Helicoverpa zea]|uniref:glutathione S-transferase S1-like n=1 Tax=Helicoverpa zea TaxID=7113 RepID=UPI001F5AE06F|nr:glutathione S-transferase S1-like [Helicoverpa zea]